MSDFHLLVFGCVVTFIGVVIWIQAALAALAGIAVLVFRGTEDFQSATGQSADALLGLAIAEAVIAVLLAWVASAILRGSRGMRMSQIMSSVA